MLFMTKDEVLALHSRLIRQIGGASGLRDEGLLESAIIAPKHRRHYEDTDLAICAATYAYHLTSNHPFVDGNKRIGAAASESFVRLNGAELIATNDEIVELFMQIAADQVTREDVELRFQQWVVPNG